MRVLTMLTLLLTSSCGGAEGQKQSRTVTDVGTGGIGAATGVDAGTGGIIAATGVDAGTANQDGRCGGPAPEPDMTCVRECVIHSPVPGHERAEPPLRYSWRRSDESLVCNHQPGSAPTPIDRQADHGIGDSVAAAAFSDIAACTFSAQHPPNYHLKCTITKACGPDGGKIRLVHVPMPQDVSYYEAGTKEPSRSLPYDVATNSVTIPALECAQAGAAYTLGYTVTALCACGKIPGKNGETFRAHQECVQRTGVEANRGCLAEP